MADTTTTEITLEDRVAYLQKTAIWNITSAATQLHRALYDARRDVDQAITMMEAGQQVYGAHSYGPLGLQTPADIAALTTKLRDAVDLAMNLGASQADVEDAYAKGVSRS
jgi:hypothetical protein